MSRYSTADENENEGSTAPAGDVLELLADARRREVVSVLESSDGDWIGRDWLSSILADSAPAKNDWEIQLEHVHLPKLEALGLIEYGSHGETIRYRHCELVSAVLETIESERPDTQG